VLSCLWFAAPAAAQPPDAVVDAVPWGRVVVYTPDPGGPDHLAWISVDGELAVVERPTTGAELRPGYVSIHTGADVDGDGAEELFVGNMAFELEQLSGPGATDATVLDVEPSCGLAAADVDGDLYDDLVSLAGTWRGSASGLVPGSPLESFDTTLDEPCGVAWSVGDIEPDGRDDVVISRSTDDNVYGVPGLTHGSLTMYLGHPSDIVPWPFFWTWEEEETIPGTSLVPMEIDGDREPELALLSTSADDSGLYGRLLVVDELDDHRGPTVLVEQDVNDHLWSMPSRTSPEPSVANVGDLDRDGDDEILLLLDGFTDGDQVRLLDMEVETDGLKKVLEPHFDLPIPAGAELDAGFPQAVVGDFDADGLPDVAIALAWNVGTTADSADDGGTVALWYGTTLHALNGDGPPAGDLGAQGCGCAQTSPSGTPLLGLLGLLGLRRRYRPSRG
jgi:MYXO-CTERM domain-containing protein